MPITLSLITASMLGILLCICLCKNSINKDGKIIKRICSFIKDGDCKAVSKSQAGKIFNTFGFSEFGLSFFLVNSIIFIFVPENITILYYYYIIATLFSFWSISYQALIIKKWCILCILAMSIIWIQTCLLSTLIPFKDVTSLVTSFSGLIIICIIGMSNLLLSMIINRTLSFIKNYTYFQKIHIQYNRLKSNTSVFKTLLHTTNRIDAKIYSAIKFGNTISKTKITIFSNLFCEPCTDLHKGITRLLNHDCEVNYFFTFFKEEQSIAIKYIIAAYFQFGASKAWDILNGWYELQYKEIDYFKQFHLNINTKQVAEEYIQQQKWIKANKLEGTPTIIVNNHILPSIYELSDLELLINLKQ
ncbi:MAG: thioredoxin domain-containing protein [Muribaculum sp.]|nr:thioredoxin domain-containing protein [Muribaculum sp.]